MVSGAGKGKAMAEEKGKRASHRIRIRMDFNPKISKLRDQEAMDRYLASYAFRLNLEIKIEIFPYAVDVSLAPPNREGVYMHLQVLVLELRLPMTRFVCSILTFYKVASSQLSAIAWCTILGFEAL